MKSNKSFTSHTWSVNQQLVNPND